MNKELIERVSNLLGETPQIVTAEIIIRMCADEAIDAANNERNSWQNAGMADIGISSAIEAIEKRMK